MDKTKTRTLYSIFFATDFKKQFASSVKICVICGKKTTSWFQDFLMPFTT
jgi:hypothetical protein